VALRDRAGNLLAVSPHPLSIIPPLNVASPSPGIHTPPPAASQMQSLGGDAGAHAAPLSPFHSISPHAGNAGGRQGPGMHAGFTLASRLDARPLHDAGASAGWADTAGSQTLHPLSYGYKRDPRTEPTVGGGGGLGGGGGWQARGGAGLGEGGWGAGGDSVTMPGWPMRAVHSPVKSPAFKPPRPARMDDEPPKHPLLSPRAIPTYTPQAHAPHVAHRELLPDAHGVSGQADAGVAGAVLQPSAIAAHGGSLDSLHVLSQDCMYFPWMRGVVGVGGSAYGATPSNNTATPSNNTRAPSRACRPPTHACTLGLAGRQRRNGPILCGNGSTGEFEAVDFVRVTTGAAQATLQMVGAAWQLTDCNIRCAYVCVHACVRVCVCACVCSRVCAGMQAARSV